MNPVTQLILGLIPNIVTLLQERHAANNPSAPPLTPDQITAGFEEAFTSSIAKDEMIRAAILAAGE